jgi:hypothetical protein
MKKYRLNKRKFARFILTTAVIAGVTTSTVSAMRTPEAEQQKFDIAIDRIEDNNIAVLEVCYKGEIEMVSLPLGEHMLDMTSVIDYEVTDGGVHLLTYDGCGYFVEINK